MNEKDEEDLPKKVNGNEIENQFQEKLVSVLHNYNGFNELIVKERNTSLQTVQETATKNKKSIKEGHKIQLSNAKLDCESKNCSNY